MCVVSLSFVSLSIAQHSEHCTLCVSCVLLQYIGTVIGIDTSVCVRAVELRQCAVKAVRLIRWDS